MLRGHLALRRRVNFVSLCALRGRLVRSVSSHCLLALMAPLVSHSVGVEPSFFLFNVLFICVLFLGHCHGLPHVRGNRERFRSDRKGAPASMCSKSLLHRWALQLQSQRWRQSGDLLSWLNVGLTVVGPCSNLLGVGLTQSRVLVWYVWCGFH